MRRFFWFGCALLVPLVVARLAAPRDPLPGLPRLMLWAWESPHDLRFVTPGDAGIAFLARTVWLDPVRAVSRPRLQPLRYNPGTALMEVVRFESAGRGLPAPREAVRETLPAANLPDVRALQVDFDARLSERSWYAEFLRDLRREIPAKTPLTITALESWCDRDNWISGLPVADATPMLFRMGSDERVPEDFSPGICRSSIGVSTDEIRPRVPRGRRVYFFHPGPWTRESYESAVAQAWRWWR
jgi:hypothetical protein